MAVFLVVGGLLGWLIAEMLVRKSFKVGSCLKTYPILAVLLVLLVVFCATGGLGYSSYCPDASQVEYAVLTVPGQSCTTNDPAEVQAIQTIHRSLAGAKEPGSDYSTIQVVYHLHSGRTVARSFPRENLTAEAEQECRALFQRQLRGGLELMLMEGDLLLNIDVDCMIEDEWSSFQLEDAESRELLRQGILADAEAGTLELTNSWFLGSSTLDPGDEYYSLHLQSWRKRSSDEARGPGAWDDPYDGAYYNIIVTPAARNTWALLEQHAGEWAIPREGPWY
jgi:hypothetical protein